MTKVINSATYQGIPCKTAMWRDTEGLGPDRGWVTIDYSAIKDLKLKFDAVPWRGDDGGPGSPAGLGIKIWWELFGKQKGTRTSNKPFKPIASGLQLYGPLILISKFDNGLAIEVRYEDIYVLNAEEVLQNLAKVLEHKEGEIQIHLTDVRQYYPKYGEISERINCRLENGKYDPRTIEKPPVRLGAGGTGTAEDRDGTPWSFEIVIRYLFSQLPGSPIVSLTGLPKLPAPEEIDHIGAPPATVLQNVLDNFGLVAKKQPDGNYLVAKITAGFLKRGQVAPSINRAEQPAHVAYEVKSAARIDVPAVVKVLGRHRYRAQSLSYVPVFKDTDGRVYRLADIGFVWDGIGIADVNRQAAKTPGKHFQNVPPKLHKPRQFPDRILEGMVERNSIKLQGTREGLESDKLHYARRKIAREQFYRMYAPAALFAVGAPTTSKGVPYFHDLDDRVFWFLPIGPLPEFESDKHEQVPKAKRVKGDRGRIVLAPPIVRGCTLGETLYTDSAEIARHHNELIDRYVESANAFGREITTKSAIVSNLGDELTRVNRQERTAEFIESALVSVGTVGNQISERLLKASRETRDSVLKKKLMLEIEIKVLTDFRQNAERTIAQLKANRAKDFKALLIAGGVQGYEQLPYGIIPESSYGLDSSTGIIKFDEVCCVVNHACVFDQEQLEVLGDGLVTVTFGHEVNDNDPSDYSSVLFMRDGKGGSKVAGVGRPSVVIPQVVRDSDIVLYEDNAADPMNLKDVIAQAEKKAKPLLEGSDSMESFVTQYSGFVKNVLERGVNGIQYVWGGGKAHTFVAVQSPGWIGPLGGVQTTRLLDRDGPGRIAAKQVS